MVRYIPDGDERRLTTAARELLELAMPFQDWTDEHHADTPKRFAKMLRDLTNRDAEEFKFTVFENVDLLDAMIVVEPVPFYTLCAHHVIPFFGHAYLAYIPDKSIAGLSKLARTVTYMSKGLWAQENLTAEIADFLENELAPLGVAVVMRAEHLCMAMRGAHISGAKTTTSAMRGVFLDTSKGARSEFLDLVRNDL